MAAQEKRAAELKVEEERKAKALAAQEKRAAELKAEEDSEAKALATKTKKKEEARLKAVALQKAKALAVQAKRIAELEKKLAVQAKRIAELKVEEDSEAKALAVQKKRDVFNKAYQDAKAKALAAEKKEQPVGMVARDQPQGDGLSWQKSLYSIDKTKKLTNRMNSDGRTCTATGGIPVQCPEVKPITVLEDAISGIDWGIYKLIVSNKEDLSEWDVEMEIMDFWTSTIPLYDAWGKGEKEFFKYVTMKIYECARANNQIEGLPCIKRLNQLQYDRYKGKHIRRTRRGF
jgi:uncharacterized coiled-coil protein SlyX